MNVLHTDREGGRTVLEYGDSFDSSLFYYEAYDISYSKNDRGPETIVFAMEEEIDDDGYERYYETLTGTFAVAFDGFSVRRIHDAEGRELPEEHVFYLGNW